MKEEKGEYLEKKKNKGDDLKEVPLLYGELTAEEIELKKKYSENKLNETI